MGAAVIDSGRDGDPFRGWAVISSYGHDDQFCDVVMIDMWSVGVEGGGEMLCGISCVIR